MLRIWLGKETTPVHHTEITLLETNIDDMNPEIYGYVMERLFEQGALDVWFTPIYMKKNRPATMISVLVPHTLETAAVKILMQETTTLGIRVRPGSKRHTAERSAFTFKSSLGGSDGKSKYDSKAAQPVYAPEYDECRRIAMELHMPIQNVYRILEQEAKDHIEHK